MNTLQDKIRGSFIGGAAGDALGYPVEGLKDFKKIKEVFGEDGITKLTPPWLAGGEKYDKALISDDTQMTLFTANGILNATRKKADMKSSICEAYLEWYLIQTGQKSKKFKDCWVAGVSELNKRRGPGRTCLSSLRAIYRGHDPVNDSKGCGGVMRVAPIPLYAVVDNRMAIMDAAHLAGETAELTHKNPLGFIPAALAAHIIYRLASDGKPTRQALDNYIQEGMGAMEKLYPQYPSDVKYMDELCDKAITLANNYRPDLENIESIGGGWSGEEALAIALYCTLRHFDNFEQALIAAVNHAGDSDSTGAITGNILGAAVGYDAIPEKFKDDLELHDVILYMADDIYKGRITYSREVWLYLNPDKESIAEKLKRCQQKMMNLSINVDRAMEKKITTGNRSFLRPMEEHVVIPMDLFIPEKAWVFIKRGRYDYEMEEHWYMYCDESTIRYYRSWTGCCVYIATYEIVSGGVRVTQLKSRRVPPRPNLRFDKDDVDLFLELLQEDMIVWPIGGSWGVLIEKKSNNEGHE